MLKKLEYGQFRPKRNDKYRYNTFVSGRVSENIWIVLVIKICGCGI